MNTESSTGRRLRRLAAGAVACIAIAGLAVACGGGGGDKDKTATKASGTPAKSAAAGTAKPGTTGTAASGTPGASGTAASGTAAPGTTPGAPTGGTPSVDANGTPIAAATPGAAASPVVVSTPLPGTGDTGSDPVTEAESTLAADSDDPVVTGGDPTKPQEVIGDVPAPPQGATIDPKTIAAPDVTDNTLQAIIDLNASQPGIQTTRTVKVGDVIRVGIVIVNADPIVATGFTVNYDRTKVIAPTIINGPSTDRNPDLNIGALGGAAANWLCSPSPTGDQDDTGSGDGDPSTGQSYLGCFTPNVAPGPAGTVVVATEEFRVVASGEVSFSLSGLSLYNDDGISEFGRCDGDPGVSNPIPCRTATLTIQ